MAGRFAERAWEAVAVAALALFIVFGSGFLWIGIPVLGFWLAGEFTTSATGFLFAVLGGIPPAMVGFGWVLYRVNGTYESLQGGDRSATPNRSPWLTSLSAERAGHRRQREPRRLIDVAMTASAILALLLMLVWFFFLAEMHLAPLGR
jgi:Na+-driven multidrug efflux pump